ncbi:MAG: hypothetical protein ACERKT_02425 [Acidobacteriota bacterium]
MSDRIDELFDRYVASFRAGNPDPAPVIEELEGADRQVLIELIDAYLDTAPSREWDPEAFAGSRADLVSDSIAVSLEGRSGRWPEVLPHLRRENEIKRKAVTDRLAGALDVTDEAEAEKVRQYYHDMEHGNLPAVGVSERVIEALASIFGTSKEKILDAGRALGPRVGFEKGPVFARSLSESDFEVALEEDSERPSRISPEPDRIDRLFNDLG